MNQSTVCDEMLVFHDNYRLKNIIDQKSQEISLSIKELHELAEKLNIIIPMT